MDRQLTTALTNLAPHASIYFLREVLERRPQPEIVLDSLEALSMADQPRSVRAAIEILRIFKD